MSQLTAAGAPVKEQLRGHRIAALSALFALLAVTALVLVVAVDDRSATETTVAHPAQAALRADSGPEESAVAASIGSPTSAGPSESSVAAAIGGPAAGTHPSGGLDESAVAVSVAQGQPSFLEQPRPDEAGIAAAISGR